MLARGEAIGSPRGEPNGTFNPGILRVLFLEINMALTSPVSKTLVAATLLFSGVTAASAAYFGNCATELNAVEAAILNSQFTGNKAATDQSNLLVKLQAAEAKVTLAKYSDAVDKLQDISDTATALASAAKAKLTDATAINNAVIAATACVANLR